MTATSDYLSRRLGDLRCEIAANRNTARRLDLEHEHMAAELREVEAAYAAVVALDGEPVGFEGRLHELMTGHKLTEGRCLTCPGGYGRHKVGGGYPELPHEVVVETKAVTNENEEA